MNWECWDREERVMRKYMRKKHIGGWQKWTPKDLRKYMGSRLKRLAKTAKSGLKPYKLSNKLYLVTSIFKGQTDILGNLNLPEIFEKHPNLAVIPNSLAETSIVKNSLGDQDERKLRMSSVDLESLAYSRISYCFIVLIVDDNTWFFFNRIEKPRRGQTI